MDVIVRFRLSNTGKRAVYFYTSWKGHIVPEGYTIRSSANQTEWFVGLEKTAKQSPGIERFMARGDGGEWVALLPGTAIEFELFDSTVRPPEKHAQTFFIRSEAKGAISEVSSDFYEVPTRLK